MENDARIYVHVPSGAWVVLSDATDGLLLGRTVREPVIRYVVDRAERFVLAAAPEGPTYDKFTEWVLDGDEDRVVRMVTGRPLRYTADQYLVYWDDPVQMAVVGPDRLSLLEEEKEPEGASPGGRVPEDPALQGGEEDLPAPVWREGVVDHNELVVALYRQYKGKAARAPAHGERDLERVVREERANPQFVRFVELKLHWLRGRAAFMEVAAEMTRAGRGPSFWEPRVQSALVDAMASSDPLLAPADALRQFAVRLRRWFGLRRAHPAQDRDARVRLSDLVGRSVRMLANREENTRFWRRFLSVFFSPQLPRGAIARADVPTEGALSVGPPQAVVAAGKRNFMFVARDAPTKGWYKVTAPLAHLGVSARDFAIAEVDAVPIDNGTPVEWTGPPFFCARFTLNNPSGSLEQLPGGRWIRRVAAEVAPHLLVAYAGDADGVRALYLYASSLEGDESAPKRVRIECAACGAPAPPKECGGCRRARYCNVRCQLSHWSGGHATECAPTAKSAPK